MSKTCPYCHSAKSLLLGNVYCSQESHAMHGLKTGTLFIRSKSLAECDPHISRLSIRLMRNGRQHYRVDNRSIVVTPESYLLVNQGQSYQTAFDAPHDLEMILVAFQPQFVADVYHTLITPDDHLMDTPGEKGVDQPPEFMEKVYPMDPVIHRVFDLLRLQIDDCSVDQERLEDLYEQLLLRMLFVHRGLRQEINNLQGVQWKTRKELYRRVVVAKEYFDAHTNRAVNLEEAAQVAHLSPHHFKRTFKAAFGQSPHQYHLKQRLRVAAELLKSGETVASAGVSTGFEDAGTLIRGFRKEFGHTPGMHQRLAHTRN